MKRYERARVAETSVAASVQRLGVLLQAGVSPSAAWAALAAAPGSSPIARAVARGPLSAHEIPERLDELARTSGRGVPGGSAWAPVAAAWRVAADAGAPLAPTLARLADVLRRADRTDAQVRTGLAGPVASARILIGLPIAGLLLGLVLGFDTARVLFATPPGWACLVVGGALLGIAAAWMRSLLRIARRRAPAPGLEAELVAIALSGGLSPDAAVDRAEEAMTRAGLEVSGGVAGTLDFARAAGVPAAALLRAEADDARQAAGDDAERRATALSVRLMLPLGMCILPAFVVLGVVPILLALLGGLRLG